MSHRNEHIIIFKHRDFRGPHRHIFGEEATPHDSEDRATNDAMSSFVVLSGNWTFFRHSNFVEQVGGRTFGPGQYEWVGDFNIPNDAVSSLRPHCSPNLIAADLRFGRPNGCRAASIGMAPPGS